MLKTVESAFDLLDNLPDSIEVRRFTPARMVFSASINVFESPFDIAFANEEIRKAVDNLSGVSDYQLISSSREGDYITHTVVLLPTSFATVSDAESIERQVKNSLALVNFFDVAYIVTQFYYYPESTVSKNDAASIVADILAENRNATTVEVVGGNYDDRRKGFHFTAKILMNGYTMQELS